MSDHWVIERFSAVAGPGFRAGWLTAAAAGSRLPLHLRSLFEAFPEVWTGGSLGEEKLEETLLRNVGFSCLVHVSR